MLAAASEVRAQYADGRNLQARLALHDRFSANRAAPFTLENGAAQLASAFRGVECEEYDDELRVTEVEPIVAYMRSAVPQMELPRDGVERLRASLAARIAAEGAVRIPKSTGLFVARAPG
jgi:hypothetical protein